MVRCIQQRKANRIACKPKEKFFHLYFLFFNFYSSSILFAAFVASIIVIIILIARRRREKRRLAVDRLTKGLSYRGYKVRSLSVRQSVYSFICPYTTPPQLKTLQPVPKPFQLTFKHPQPIFTPSHPLHRFTFFYLPGPRKIHRDLQGSNRPRASRSIGVGGDKVHPVPPKTIEGIGGANEPSLLRRRRERSRRR